MIQLKEIDILFSSMSLMMVVLLSHLAWAQDGQEACRAGDSSVDSPSVITPILARPDPAPLYDALTDYFSSGHFSGSAKDMLSGLVEIYGAELVAGALVSLVHFESPDGANIEVRHRAAIAYGLLHSLYPEHAALPIVSEMILNPAYPDGVKEGLAIASHYVTGDTASRGLNRALGVQLCLAGFHLRPFAGEPHDFLTRVSQRRLYWYRAALSLLRETTYALALRGEGRAVIDEFLQRERNEALAERVREWAENAESRIPYFP